MAEEDSPKSYFYVDEDVFIGKKRSQREIIKSTLMGQNYDSPVPRPNGSSTSILPDVISVSSDNNPAELMENVESTDSSCFLFANQKDDDIISIDSDSQNNSVEIISDDDSKEEKLTRCNSAVKRFIDTWNHDNASVIEINDVIKEVDSMEMPVEISDFVKECVSQDNGENVSQQNTDRLESKKTSLDVISDLKTHLKENEVFSSSSISLGASMEDSKKPEAHTVVDMSKLDVVFKPSLGNSTFSNLDFSLLTGVSNSILDISHGSSLPSPAVAHNDSSLGLLATAVYEDISCDGDQMFDTCEKQLKPAEVDLHMSIDEETVQGLDQNMGSNVTLPTLYNSCLTEFSNSVYITANNTENISAIKQPSSSFSSYRDTFDASVLPEEMDNVHCTDVGNDKKNETSFEIVMSNRQSSFTNTNVKENKTEKTAEKSKPFLSKLPVFGCTSNLLKPSLLQANIDNKLKDKNFKWAKTLSKPYQTEQKNTVKTNKTIVKTINEKLLNSEQQKKPPSKSLSIHKLMPNKTPGKRVVDKPTSDDTKTPCKTHVNEPTPKSTTFSKTPDKRTLSQLPKLSKSDAKTPKEVRPPTAPSSGKVNYNKNLLIDKERYKNVISPVRAYINNAPIQIQRNAHVPEEQIVLMGGSAKKAESRIPKSVSTPLSGSRIKTTGIPINSSKVAQKLVYNKNQNQENMDPNYTRDTLPPRMFQAAAAVFIKEPEPPKRHLPKMGESMQKLIDTPRPKVTVHQGRVKESPRAKGVLIPSINIVPSTPETSDQRAAADSRISIRVVKSADASDN